LFFIKPNHFPNSGAFQLHRPGLVILFVATVSAKAGILDNMNANYLAVDLITYVHSKHGVMPANWTEFSSWVDNKDYKGKWTHEFLKKFGYLAWSIDVKVVPVGTKLITITNPEYQKYEKWMNSYLWQYLQNEKLEENKK
jgi:hypothetical protein